MAGLIQQIDKKLLKNQSIQKVQTQSSQRKFLQDNRESSLQLKTNVMQQNKTGLPDNLKSGMESLSGINLDQVKVHYNSSKPAAVQAHAYAQGNDIHLASGQEKHLPHELGHVVQQAQGRVKPTINVAGVAVNDNVQLENEATQMGNMALQKKVIENKPLALLSNSNSTGLNHHNAIQKVRLGDAETQNDDDIAKVKHYLNNASKDELITIFRDLQAENGRNAQYYLEYIHSLWVDQQIADTPYRRDKVNIVVSIWINGVPVYQTTPWLSGYQPDFEEAFPFRQTASNPYEKPDNSHESTISQNDAEVKAFFDVEDALKSILSIYGREVHSIEFVITGNKGACDGCKLRRQELMRNAEAIASQYPSSKTADISSQEIYDDKKLNVNRNSRKYGVSSNTTYGRKKDRQYQSETNSKLKMFSDEPLAKPSRMPFGNKEKVPEMSMPSHPIGNLLDATAEQIQTLVQTEQALFFANAEQVFNAFQRGQILLEQQFVMPAETPAGFAVFRVVQNPVVATQFHIARCLRGG